MLVPVLPLYAAEFEISYALVGLVLSGEGLGTLLGDVPAGILLRRWGVRRVMLMGIACTGLAVLALFWAGSIPQVLALRMLAGFGRAMFSVSRHAYVAGAIPTTIRGRAISVLGGVFRLGNFAGPAAGGVIAATFGLRAPFLLFAGTSGLAMAVISFYLRTDRPNPTPERPTPPGLASQLVSTLKTQQHTFASAGTAQLFAQMVRAGRQIIVPLYGADTIGLSVQDIGFILSLASAVDMTLFLPTGWIMDHLGRKYAIVPCFSIQALGMFLVSFSGSFTGLLLATTLIGFGNGLGAGTMMTLGADLAPRETRGEFLGLWRLIGDLGATGAPLIVGTVAQLVALQAAVWALSASGFVAAGIFGLFVPETLKNGRQPYHQPSS